MLPKKILFSQIQLLVFACLAIRWIKKLSPAPVEELLHIGPAPQQAPLIISCLVAQSQRHV